MPEPPISRVVIMIQLDAPSFNVGCIMGVFEMGIGSSGLEFWHR